MTAGSVATAIPTHILWDDYYENMHGAYNSLRQAVASSGMTQDELAEKLDLSKSRISKVLSGKENLTVKTLSYFGTAVNCRVVVKYVPYDQIGYTNVFVLTRHSGNVANEPRKRAGTTPSRADYLVKQLTSTP